MSPICRTAATVTEVAADVSALVAIAYGTERSDSDSQNKEQTPDIPDEGSCTAELISRLSATRCSSFETLLQLGAGCGKVVLRTFLNCPSLRHVVGVEMSQHQFNLAIEALMRLSKAMPARFVLQHSGDPVCPSATFLDYKGGIRKLELRQGDLLAVPQREVVSADIVIVQAKLQMDLQARLQRLMSCAKDSSYLLLRSDLSVEWCLDEPSFWHELDSRKHCLLEHPYFIYNADRMRTASITCDSARKAAAAREMSEDHVNSGLRKRYSSRAFRSFKTLASFLCEYCADYRNHLSLTPPQFMSPPSAPNPQVQI